MAFSAETAIRIQEALAGLNQSFEEKKMFGGLSFLYKGKMTVGIVREDLAVRIVEQTIESALKNPHVRPMDFTRKPMKEFVFVSPEGFETYEQLMHWIELGVEHAKSKAD